jgi:hypothetical protein
MNAGQVPDVLVDDTALALAIRAVRDRQLHLVAVERNASGDPARHRDAELAHRDLNPTLAHRPLLFLSSLHILSLLQLAVGRHVG